MTHNCTSQDERLHSRPNRNVDETPAYFNKPSNYITDFRAKSVLKIWNFQIGSNSTW